MLLTGLLLVFSFTFLPISSKLEPACLLKDSIVCTLSSFFSSIPVFELKKY
jgi:hypothetical protein